MDGYELCKQLKQNDKTSHIPLIMLTAKASHESKVKGLQFGADAYLTKPFKEDELIVRIERLIATRLKLQTVYSNQSISFGSKEVDESQINPKDVSFISKIDEIIQENLDNSNFEIPMLSEKLFMSQIQVYRKLKALTGKTPFSIHSFISFAKG